jgi:hypothetical protein
MKRLITLVIIVSLVACSKEDIIAVTTPISKSTESTSIPTTQPIQTYQWLSIPSGYASFAQFDYNNDLLEDIVQFQGYDMRVPYTWPGPSFYSSIDGALVPGNIKLISRRLFASSILTGDFNSDGFTDMFLLTGMDPAGCTNCREPLAPLYVLTNKQGGEFIVDTLNYQGVWNAGATADIDKDGDLDVIAFSIHHEYADGIENKVFINNGKGNFTTKQSDLDKIEFTDNVELVDMNSDGYPELIINDVTSWNTLGPHINRFRIFWNDKQGNFTESNTTTIPIPDPMYTTQIVAYDLDRDGYKEIVLPLSHLDGGWELQVYKTKDNKTFTEVTKQLVHNNIFNNISKLGHIAILDLDNNGLLDIFSKDKSKNLRWELNNNSTFSLHQ